MESCCKAEGPAPAPAACPECHQPGRPVARATVGALARSEVDAARLSGRDYRFCASPDCPVVYFSPDREPLRRHDLRAPVHQKDLGPDVPLCYCFGYTRARLAREGDAALAFVTAQVRAKRCACDIKNPSGRCCLADLRRFLREERAAATSDWAGPG